MLAIDVFKAINSIDSSYTRKKIHTKSKKKGTAGEILLDKNTEQTHCSKQMELSSTRNENC